MFGAVLVGSEAESATAAYCALRAATPADRANTIGIVFTGRVAKASIIVLLILLTGQSLAKCTAVGVLAAGEADVAHATGAIG